LAAGGACAWLLSLTVSGGSEVDFAVCGSGLAVVAFGAACAAGWAVLACVELLMEMLMEELSASGDSPLGWQREETRIFGKKYQGKSYWRLG
jgi:hypothetical protein